MTWRQHVANFCPQKIPRVPRSVCSFWSWSATGCHAPNASARKRKRANVNRPGRYTRGFSENPRFRYGECVIVPHTCTIATGKTSVPWISLQWRHNEHDAVSNHLRLDCLFNHLFRPWSKKTSKLHVTVLCEFAAQTASDAENVSIWWHHHAGAVSVKCISWDTYALSHSCAFKAFEYLGYCACLL